jgi:hypothetical protein
MGYASTHTAKVVTLVNLWSSTKITLQSIFRKSRSKRRDQDLALA